MDNEKKFGIGIRGTGQVAVQHAQAILENPQTYIAAVCGRTEDSGKSFAAQYAPEAKVYKQYTDMLADTAVDIVSECMPNYLHSEEAVAALYAGKHVILEKPAGITPEQTEALRAAAEKTGKKSVVSFVLRWHPLSLNIKNMLSKNMFGDIYYTETDYWHGISPHFSSYNWIRKKEFAGGAMITGGCHAVDTARYFSGDISEVFAYSTKVRQDFDYSTTYIASVKFTNGRIGKISASLDTTMSPYQFNIDLLGSRGACRDNRFYAKDFFPNQNDWIKIKCETPNSGSVSHHPFKSEINNFINALLGKEAVLSDIPDACKTMQTVYAIMESAQTGKPVMVR